VWRSEVQLHSLLISALNGSAYCSVQNLLSSCFLSKDIRTKIDRILILPDFFGRGVCEVPSPILREEHRLRVFENRVLCKIMGPKKEEVTGEWRRLHNGEPTACTAHQILFGVSKQEE